MTKNKLPLWRIDNLYAWIGLAITIGSLWISISGDIRDIKKDIAYIKIEVSEYNERNKDIQTRLGINEKNVAVIFSKLGIE